MKELNPSIYTLEKPRSLTYSLLNKPDIPFNRLVTLGSKNENRKIDISDMLEALTLHGAGELFDMEKLETLGGSFLRYSMTLALFCNESISKGDEGFLTQYRSSLVGNKRLFILAKSLNLEKLISGLKFEPHLNWRPPRFSNDQDLEKEVIEWDNEFRKSLKDEADETPEAKKVSVSKVTLFQMMEEKDWIRIRTLRPSEKCKREFMKTMKRRLENEAIPDGYKVRARNHVLLSDKSISDVVEALIGVHLANAGQAGAADFLTFLGLGFGPDVIDYNNNERKVGEKIWFQSAIGKMPQTSLWMVREAGSFDTFEKRDMEESLDTFMRKINMVVLQDTLGYVFKEKSFLLQALTHASYTLNKITESCERLEFLGDAVLDYLVVCYLVTKNPNLTPVEITDMKSALVNNNNLADIAVRNGLQKHLLQQSPELFRRIGDYVIDHDSTLENTADITIWNVTTRMNVLYLNKLKFQKRLGIWSNR